MTGTTLLLILLYFATTASAALLLFEGTVRAVAWLERRRDED